MVSRLLAQIVLVALAGAVAASAAPASHPVRQPAPIVVRSDGSGFDWGDAAIGAAAALGVVLAVAGVIVQRVVESRSIGESRAIDEVIHP
jgi:hypothetical protein